MARPAACRTYETSYYFVYAVLSLVAIPFSPSFADHEMRERNHNAKRAMGREKHRMQTMSIIDAHMHYGDDHPDTLALLQDLDIKFLNFCVADSGPGILGEQTRDSWHGQADLYRELARSCPLHCH